MAHSRSAKKRVRQNERRRARNRAQRSAMRTQIKASDAKLESGDLESAAGIVKATLRKVDKTAAKGAIHPRTAARTKSRLQRRLNKSAASKKS